MRVTQLINKNNNAMANHFVIDDDNGNSLLQSYKVIVAKIDYENDKIFLDRDFFDYSLTTKRAINFFLNNTHQERLKLIKENKIQLINLN